MGTMMLPWLMTFANLLLRDSQNSRFGVGIIGVGSLAILSRSGVKHLMTISNVQLQE